MMNTKLIAGATAAALMLSSGVAFADTMMTTSAMAGTSMSSDMMMSLSSAGNLTVGSRGVAVVSLQTWLVSAGYLTMPAGVSMGYFGSITKAALAAYQSSVGLPAHGYFGALTRAKIAAMGNMTDSTGSTGSTGGSMSTGVMVGGALMTPDKDIVTNAGNANNVTTVVAAVKAAGLVATLQGAGPFTVFAPDNNAFNKLPAGTVANLLLPANINQLKDILTYHVVPGRYTSADLHDGQILTTVEGKQITIGKSASGQISVNGTAMVETPDVISSNGVTFVIDSVLMPPTGTMVGGALMTPDKDIVVNAGNASNASTVVAAVKAAGLVSTLQGPGPFTVFAPDNNAFAKLPAGTVANLLLPANLNQLKDILTYHVVAGKYTAANLTDGQVLTTVEGKTIKINKNASGQITVNGNAMVEIPDIMSSNGVTFLIDTVLMPPTN